MVLNALLLCALPPSFLWPHFPSPVPQVSRGLFVDNFARLLNALATICASAMARLLALSTHSTTLGLGEGTVGAPSPLDAPPSPSPLAALLLHSPSPRLGVDPGEAVVGVEVAGNKVLTGEEGEEANDGDAGHGGTGTGSSSAGSGRASFNESGSHGSRSSVCDFSSGGDGEGGPLDGLAQVPIDGGSDVPVVEHATGAEAGGDLTPAPQHTPAEAAAHPPLPLGPLGPATLSADDIVALMASAILFEDAELSGFAPFSVVWTARAADLERTLRRVSPSDGTWFACVCVLVW